MQKLSFMAIILGLGPLFYILWASRSRVEGLGSQGIPRRAVALRIPGVLSLLSFEVLLRGFLLFGIPIGIYPLSVPLRFLSHGCLRHPTGEKALLRNSKVWLQCSRSLVISEAKKGREQPVFS